MTVSVLEDQTKWNRFLLMLTAIFTVSGLGNNIMRTYMTPSFPSETMTMLWMVTMGLWILAILFAVSFGLVRGPSTFETWGFVMNRPLWISLVLVVISGLIAVVQISGTSWFLGVPQLVSVGTVTMEEVFFRGILISTLLSVVQPKSRWTVAGLICAAAVVFVVVHIPTKNAAELLGIFSSGTLFGYVYYYTRSLLLPIFVHVVANTAEKAGMFGGALAVVVYFVVAGIVWLWSKSKARVEVPAT